MKQGRPRKPDAPRKPSGKTRDVPQNPAATDEQQARIKFLTGNSRRGNAESPMGVLVAHGLVDQDVLDKITTPYLLAKKTCFGTYGPVCPGDGSERGHQTSSDKAEVSARKHIDRCNRVLKRIKNPKMRELFDDWIVREIVPNWMEPKSGDIVLDQDGVPCCVRPLVLDPDYNFELKLVIRILQLLAKEFSIRKPARTEMVVVRNFQQADPGV